jgi:hypothetical protein
VWRSVRAGGDTKTPKSRRTLALPKRCVEALKFSRRPQEEDREPAEKKWRDHDLLLASRVGTPRNPNKVLRSFRIILGRTDLDP